VVELLECITRRRALRSPQPEQAGDVLLTWEETSKSGRLLG